jgi:hypothetical protein
MGFIVTDALEVEVLNTLLNTPLSLRLFSNNFTPIGTMAIGSFTEVAGGGYAAKPILFAGWTIVSGVSRATFSPLQQWTFTGPPSGPGTVYGYYLTRDSDSRVYLAERFSAALVPFNPVNGSNIRVALAFDATSQF